MFHFGLTFLVQGNWYKKFVSKELKESTVDNEVELAILGPNSTSNLTSYLITKEYSRKGKVPHYHVYICCDQISIMDINEIYTYGYVWCKELNGIEHYINYITKYYCTEKIVRCVYPVDKEHDPHGLFNLYTKCMKRHFSMTVSIIERMVGMTIEEYIKVNDIKQIQLDEGEMDEDYGPPF